MPSPVQIVSGTVSEEPDRGNAELPDVNTDHHPVNIMTVLICANVIFFAAPLLPPRGLATTATNIVNFRLINFWMVHRIRLSLTGEYTEHHANSANIIEDKMPA